MMSLVYIIPIWFQAIKGASAVHSGIMNLPMVLGITVSSIIAGLLTRKIGYYTQWMYAGSILTPIAAGLMTTFTPHTNHDAWIGYQVLYGLGLGLGMQQPSVAAQTVLSRKDVATGVSMIFFAQMLGGSIFVSVANNIFNNKLARGLERVVGIDPDLVTHVGATDLRHVIPLARLPAVLTVYNNALTSAFYVGLAASCATVVGAAMMEWVNLNKKAEEQKKEMAAEKVSRNAAALAGSDDTSPG
jgi:hypothetical protein